MGISPIEKQLAIEAYKKRERTIRQLAEDNDISYSSMRKIIVNAGYSNTLKR